MRVEITGTIGKFKASAEFDEESQAIVVTMSVKAKMHPGDLARVLYLQTNKAPMFFNIGSKQAALDLTFNSVGEPATTPMDTILEAAQKAKAAVDAEAAKTGDDDGSLPPGVVVIPAAEPAPPIKMVECPECHGSGKSNDPGFCCDICRGEGSVSSRAVNPAEIVFSVEHHPAEPGNNGNGKTPKRRGRRAKKETAPAVLVANET